jgi:hypothetical protein
MLGNDEITQREDRIGSTDARYQYLRRGIYVDQLLHWRKCFSKDQILVLKSEDFFERTLETLNVVLEFLDLPNWEPEASEKRNKGKYDAEMDPATRRRLDEYFEPHNERLYKQWGVDFRVAAAVL